MFDEKDDDDAELLREAERYLARDLRERLPDFERAEDIRPSAIRALRRFFQSEIGYKPVISIAIVPS